MVEGLFESYSKFLVYYEAGIFNFYVVGALGGPEVGRKRFLSPYSPFFHHILQRITF